ncbi:Ribosomal protein S5, N-terminal,Ribosomal protein S5 domain 2-type fold,Ribosomal protein S5, C- [Cinara cedri]|uniref:Small ribosomal subunit protein uS5m n=1 Tax=Cinara cedri TaxID=506608 RepID=A0A5E4N9P4_9HEMI|nr:Ribosomal protein S5, N-terminal,Ribosomal protein S5 domain 2-type fold,Ribosomal protein S5, C- [Cinara cedri]
MMSSMLKRILLPNSIFSTVQNVVSIKRSEILKECTRSYSKLFVSPTQILQFKPVHIQQNRQESFFKKHTAEHIWKSVTSVSNAGKKRGRGKGAGKKRAKNLNKGQVLGVGVDNMVWPGLNAPIIKGRDLIKRTQLPPDPDREARLIKLRDAMGTFRFLKLMPTERGWSGNKMPGRSIGPPDSINEYSFDGFDTKVLEFKTVFCMKSNAGRYRRISVVAVTGNKNGLAGFALGKAADARAALKRAKNRAGQKLMYIERYENHTVYHDFFTQFCNTKIFVEKRPEGYGLHCHRAIKTICEIIGIKNLYAKVEGSTNLQNLVKAFFLGLLKQKTHQQLADETKYHLVEFRKENDYLPVVVASPNGDVKTDPKEAPDFLQYVMDNKVRLRKKKFPPFYTKKTHWYIKEKKMETIRNMEKAKLNLIAEYGEIRSFLTDTYPECRPLQKNEFKKQTEEDQ